MFVINSVLLLTLIASSVIMASEYPKIRRAGSMTMYPFPRVGRSQPERTWMMQESADIHDDMKRAYLIPFPRVGRAMYEPNGKRANGDVPGGMWFGPRLGRVSKRNFYGYEEELPWDFKDAEQTDDEQADLLPQAARLNIESQ